MTPAVPPLPTPWNFPFHVVIGNQTSKRTAGFVSATTRQNAGRLLSACDPGGVNDGPAISATDSIVVSGSAAFVSAAHCAPVIAGGGASEAADGEATKTATAAARGNTDAEMMSTRRMTPPLDRRGLLSSADSAMQ